ncbi:MAG TPA: membrane dipeptidase [Solirubrobacteraceae bacterium]|nr:membrane dipeptidase [Solirubrobacteraceae bacterium]
MRPVIDGHNDVLSHLHEQDAADDALLTEDAATVSVPRAKAGGFAAGMFAVLPPAGDWDIQRTAGGYDIPYAPSVPWEESARSVGALGARLFRLLRACNGAVRLVRDAEDLDACLAGEALGVVFHMEGAEAIDTDLEALDVWYEAGLRSLGPVWSRANAFAHGVPFRYPASPDVGPGLTDAGEKLVRRCAELGIAVDLSHLNLAGFWDVARVLDGPLIASHSSVYKLCTYTRNVTDDQLDAIASSGGLVGINFDVGSLREDGGDDADTPLSRIAEHARYVADRCGVDHVALGSDFDGATMPHEVPDASAYQRVLAALEAEGFENDEVDRIAWKNWRRVLAAAWG